MNLKKNEKIKNSPNNNINTIINMNQEKINNPPQQNSRNRNVASAIKRGQLENIDLLMLCGRIHENVGQFWRTIVDTSRLQFDPTGNVINLSIKTFSRDVFKLLNENSNFIAM